MDQSCDVFPPEVIEKLGYYVYRLIDPRNGETFYIGKGKGNRIFAHIREQAIEGDELSSKIKRIREIRVAGFEVAHVIHRHGMDERTAFEVESALMDAYPGLTNQAGGMGGNEFGAMHAMEVIREYTAEPAVFVHNVILISVNRSALAESSIYEATRYAWKVSAEKARKAEFVLATVQGVIASHWAAAVPLWYSPAAMSSNSMSGRGAMRFLPWLITPIACAALLSTYLISPDFYQRYVLNAFIRETQVVEMTTFICAAAAGLTLLWAVARLLKLRPEPNQDEALLWRLADRWGAVAIVGAAAGAALFFAGEEVNWGQTFVHWNVPETEKPEPINFHNNDSHLLISVNTLGSLWLFLHFFGLPIAWALRKKWRTPRSWRVVIAEGPVMFSIAMAEIWQLPRDLYDRPESPGEDAFWDGFMWQMNEQKEMLVAMALLMYAVYRVVKLRREAPVAN